MPTDLTLTSALRNNLQYLQKTKGAHSASDSGCTMDTDNEQEVIGKAARDFCTHIISAHTSALTSNLDEISGSIKALEHSSQIISGLLGLLSNAELATLAAQSSLDVDENADISKFEQALLSVIESARVVIQDNALFEDGMALENISLSSPSSVSDSIEIIRNAIDEIQGMKTTIITDLDDIRTRQDFTQGTIDTLESGRKEISITNLNEEGARLLALQTRITLSTTSVPLASPTQEDVLHLF